MFRAVRTPLSTLCSLALTSEGTRSSSRLCTSRISRLVGCRTRPRLCTTGDESCRHRSCSSRQHQWSPSWTSWRLLIGRVSLVAVFSNCPPSFSLIPTDRWPAIGTLRRISNQHDDSQNHFDQDLDQSVELLDADRVDDVANCLLNYFVSVVKATG